MEEIFEGMHFGFISKIEIEESFKEGKTIISGTLITEGTSKNNVYYSMAELKNIADSAVGVPLRFGTEMRMNPNSGRVDPNMHNLKNEVGRIIKAVVDRAKRKIKFWAEVFNKNPAFPKIAETVAKGWGVSIGGIAKTGKWVLNQLGRLVLKVVGVRLNHVQLLKPETKRGVDEAKVETVEVQETLLEFSSLPKIRINLSMKDYMRIDKFKIKI